MALVQEVGGRRQRRLGLKQGDERRGQIPGLLRTCRWIGCGEKKGCREAVPTGGFRGP